MMKTNILFSKQDSVHFTEQIVKPPIPAQEISGVEVEDNSICNEFNDFSPKSPNKDSLKNLSLTNISEIYDSIMNTELASPSVCINSIRAGKT